MAKFSSWMGGFYGFLMLGFSIGENARIEVVVGQRIEYLSQHLWKSISNGIVGSAIIHSKQRRDTGVPWTRDIFRVKKPLTELGFFLSRVGLKCEDSL